MKQKWVDAFMDTATRFADLSSAVRLKVGAVIVKDNRVISIGYNGMPSGWTNECETKIYCDDGDVYEQQYPKDSNTWERYKLVTKDEVIHAEANAILKLARDGESGNGSSLFCTHAPCIHCSKLIHGAGISKVYYRNTYRDELGLEFLQKCGIDIEKTD